MVESEFVALDKTEEETLCGHCGVPDPKSIGAAVEVLTLLYPRRPTMINLKHPRDAEFSLRNYFLTGLNKLLYGFVTVIYLI
ncbi:hypothetical protein GQ457_02G027860 [Hibiscus cannabinus]